MQFTSKKDFYINSDKYLIENTATKNLPIYYWQTKSYSSQFYSKGKVKEISDENDLRNHLSSDASFFVIIPHKRLKNIKDSSLNLLHKIDENYKNGMYLYEK